MSDKIILATEMSTKAHTGQVRKYTGEAYINHPLEVAELYKTAHDALAREGDKGVRKMYARELDRGIIAAIMHDTAEDTDLTYTEIARALGEDAATDTWWLTDDVPNSKGSRAIRKAISVQKLQSAPPLIARIKMCDNISNLQSIAVHDPNFAIVYAKEKQVALDAMLATSLSRFRDPIFLGLHAQVQRIVSEILA